MNGHIAFVAGMAFIVAIALTGWFRHYAIKRGLLDVPNARSSHDIPTPRGGGVAIVVAVLIGIATLAMLQVMPWNVAQGLLSAGVLAAVIGYADDRMSVPLLLRLFVQFAAGGAVVLFLGADGINKALPSLAAMPWIGATLALFYLVWMLNLTNFMDGIDGIASVEAISVCLGAIVCVCIAATEISTLPDATVVGVAIERRDATIAFAALLAAACAGFLKWNWPPARIFMGDAGSGFVGVLLGALTLLAGRVNFVLLWACVILAGVFVVDATTTLFRRAARGERFYQAHRSHAYQHAARRYGHRRVTSVVALINVVWLLPWAALAARGVLHGTVALALAWIPLVGAALRYRAGLPETAVQPTD